MRKDIFKTAGKVFWLIPLFLVGAASMAFAADGDYNQILGLSSRKVIWFIAQMHLYFGAFVLGVPIFVAVIEYAGYKSGDKKLDKLAYEFTSLLSVAYATTAAIGGTLVFSFMVLYPTFWGYMANAFQGAMIFYALLFFGETLFLYVYYYGWDFMNDKTPFPKSICYPLYGFGVLLFIFSVMFFLGYIHVPGHTVHFHGDLLAFWGVTGIFGGLSFFVIKHKKGLHIWIGIWLNIFGTLIMMVANSWASYMMSPTGFDPKTFEFIGTTLDAVANPLWIPVGIHRMLGNVAFGGFVGGAYAAVKFIGSKTPEERAHYDWMGYIANFVGVSGLIPLPFAGYYLGREVYSNSAVMGNNMMGGDFSWTFIIQAMLVGGLFLTACFYLWSGMGRIPGADRYRGYVKYLNSFILISFAIWLTPHNLPLTGSEVSAMGGSQYHPTLKFLGLMPAKNAVVNLIIISTYISFLLYKRGNKGDMIPISKQGKGPVIAIAGAAALCLYMVGGYAYGLYTMDPAALDLPADRAVYFQTTAYLLFTTCAMIVITSIMALKDKGILAQYIWFGWVIFSIVIFLGVYGFVVMEKASPFLRNIAVSQFLQLISTIVLMTTIDVFLFAGAKEIGPIRWGNVSHRSQYALLTLCILITFNMGLMGFIRSSLRTNWHIYGVMKDTSQWAFTATNFDMTYMVSAATLTFMVSVAVMFWLTAIAKAGHKDESETKGGAGMEPVMGG